MDGNDYLYNELLEFCSGDPDELERTLTYFQSRLESDRRAEEENALDDELDDENE